MVLYRYLFLSLLLSLTTFCSANRKVTITKTGTDPLISLSAMFPPAGYTINSSSYSLEIVESSFDVNRNWTEVFNEVSRLVNDDPESKTNGSAMYDIVLETNNVNSAYLVGDQLEGSNPYKLGKEIFGFHGSPGNEIISQIKLHSSSSGQQVFLKFADDLLYGSWLRPGATITYYLFQYNEDGDISNGCELNVATTSDPYDTNYFPHQPPCNVTSQPYTNPSSIEPQSLKEIVIPPTYQWRQVLLGSIACSAGIFISAASCTKLTASDLAVYGNNIMCRLDGVHGDVGIQLDYSGINLHDCRNVTVENSNFNNFGMDGIRIDGINTQHIELIKCNFEYNGRQAFSWLAGDDLTATNCAFNYSGKAICINPHLLSPSSIASAPGAGFDIEPGSSQTTTNGTFTLCSFKDNIGECLVNNTDYPENTSFIKFDQCTFIRDGVGIKVKGKGFTFDHCTFNTLCADGYAGLNVGPGNSTTFKNHCTFIDQLPSGGSFSTASWQPLYRINAAKNLRFENCDFSVYSPDREMFEMASNASILTEDHWHIFDNCNFTYEANGAANSTAHSGLYNIFFKHRNAISNNYSGTLSNPSLHRWVVHDAILVGSDVDCDPAELTITGQIELVVNTGSSFDIGRNINSSAADGYARLILTSQALLKMNTTQEKIKIRGKSYLEIEQDAGLMGGGWYENNGKLVCKNGSYLNLFITGGFQHDITGNGLFFIDANCNSVNSVIPYWQSVLGYPNQVNWLSNSSICIQGRTSLPTGINACPSPIYANISAGNAFAVMYNYQHVSCNGLNDGAIQLQISGGVGPYDYYIDAPPFITGNSSSISIGLPTTPLNAGSHVVVVKDANGCSNTFTVTITEPAAVGVNATYTHVTCNGAADGTIVATGSAGSTITINSASPAANYGPGVYTVVATAPGGNAGLTCTATTTVTITEPIAVTVNATFTNVSCNSAADGTITATGSPGSTISINGAPPAANYGPGVYTVVATASGGNAGQTCTATQTVIIGQPTSQHCGCQHGIDLVANTPNLILVSNLSASALINLYNSGDPTFTNKTLYIDGVLTIDQSITFIGCTLWFTTTGQVVLANGSVQFNTMNSTLEAACDWWDGISANYSGNKVSASNNTNINKAIHGVSVSNNALLEVSNSHFNNNGLSCISMSNIITSSYPGFITNSTFNTLSNNPAPYNKTRYGVVLSDVRNMNIGDITDGASINSFDGMYCGIITEVDNIPNSTVGIYNCSFGNIKNDVSTSSTPDADLINNCYQTNRGGAIVGTTGTPGVNNLSLDVRNTNPANSGLAFTNCDKGIVTIQSALTAHNLYMDHVPMGMMNFSIVATTGTTNQYDVQQCKLYHTHLGMQFIGEKKNCMVKQNTIQCDYYNQWVPQTPPGLGATYTWPKAIEVSNANNSGISTFNIYNNLITIPATQYAGLGISVDKGGNGVTVEYNNIDLQTSDAAEIGCAGPTTLAGVYSNLAKGVTIRSNVVTGNTAGSYIPADAGGRVSATGILINKGDNQVISCNQVLGSRFGLLAWDANNLSPACSLYVRGNVVNDADAGWVFRHLANEGTLGNVGSLSNDNNNLFPTLSNRAKVFKFCLGQTPNWFFTSSISQLTESLSENMNTLLNTCPYLIQANPGATVFDLVNDCGGGLQFAPWDGSEISLDEAMAIATDTKIYVEFPILAHWYDCKRLYEFLSSTPTLLSDYATLDSFYTAMSNDAIAQIESTDQQLKNLLQSFDIFTPAQRDAMLTYIENTNNSINNSDIQNENEREINRIYLRLVRLGIDSLLEEDKVAINTLALQCPYVGGSAVYKARSLNYYLEPGAMYDDMKACNAVNVYKQGNTNNSNGSDTSLITLENEALSKIRVKHGGTPITQNDVCVYPVPAKNHVYINYATNNDAVFTLYNSIGETILTQNLFKQNTKQRIELNNIADGIYKYEVLFANKLKSIGKLVILN